MTLMEIMVAITVLLGLSLVVLPGLGTMFGIQQRHAAKRIVLMYEQLRDEAVMRNVAFRVTYDLNQNTYKVEAGERGALIFDSPEAKEAYEEEMEQRSDFMDDEEKAAFESANQRFTAATGQLSMNVTLPSGTIWGGVYTPQYGELVVPEFDLDEDETPPVVQSHIFPNGFMERTLVLMVSESNKEDGYTIEVEPLSGDITLHPTLIDWEELYDFVPEEGPRLPL